jgi:lysophospholipase L1-like esterase
LKVRWQDDVLNLKPDWLSIMIGINDVWRQFDTPKITEGHVGLEEYETTLKELIHLARPNLKGLILCTPYFIEPNLQDAMRKRMDEYSDVVRKLADEFDAVLVDTQAAFDRILKVMHPMTLAWDRIHPDTSGHAIIAKCFLDAVGCNM